MADWTTKKINDELEIDLHYDLDSFPAVLRSKNVVSLGGTNGLLLSTKEAHALMLLLIEHFGMKVVKKNETT
jgi:hypothetical protein